MLLRDAWKETVQEREMRGAVEKVRGVLEAEVAALSCTAPRAPEATEGKEEGFEVVLKAPTLHYLNLAQL